MRCQLCFRNAPLTPFRLPIPNQPEYIRRALSAGKHVLSEKPIAENLEDAQELMRWYHEDHDSKRVTWSVAENFRYLNSFEYAREQVHRAGRLLGFRVKVYSMVKPGGKYFGEKGASSDYGPLLRLSRDCMAKESYTSRGLPPGRWSAPYCWPKASSWL